MTLRAVGVSVKPRTKNKVTERNEVAGYVSLAKQTDARFR